MYTECPRVLGHPVCGSFYKGLGRNLPLFGRGRGRKANVDTANNQRMGKGYRGIHCTILEILLYI